MLPVDGACQQPVILEVIGPAGAGKSSLCLLLARRERTTRTSIWETPQSRLTLDSLCTLPTLAVLSMHTGALPWAEFKHVVRVRNLRRRLHRMPGSFRLVVLDEGPVFTVTWLLVSGHRRIREGRLEDWWRRRLFEWASDLDLVVALDAADELLAQRIRSRPKAHEIKQKSDEEIYAFLHRFRSAFDLVLTELVRERGTRVLRLSGDRGSQPLADDLIQAVSGGVHAN